MNGALNGAYIEALVVNAGAASLAGPASYQPRDVTAHAVTSGVTSHSQSGTVTGHSYSSTPITRH